MTTTPPPPAHGTFDPLDHSLLDRASGVLLAQAAGDALGVPYEFAQPPGPGQRDAVAVMRGGGLGPYAPGEWSDDTQMSVCVARVTAARDVLSPVPDAFGATPLDEVAAAFEAWRTGGATDVGTQTAAVLRDAAARRGPAATRLRDAARALHAATGRTAGNGALMRTGVVGLVALTDRDETARAARAVAEVTHTDPLAAESCVLWSEAVRVAVTEERLDVRAGLDLLDADAAARWSAWITDAELPRPAADLRQNGFTVTALQAAWHAIATTSGAEGPSFAHRNHVVAALQKAVGLGGDTDTVAAIAGSLLGARYGARSVPDEWASAVHGWPGIGVRVLTALARRTAQGGLARAGGLALPDGGTAPAQWCPVCGTRQRENPRYPRHVCAWCSAAVTDEAGRPVSLSNVDLGGGYQAHYLDGSPATGAVRGGRVWIGGVEHRARDARFGGIVVEPLADAP
ncbi:ADP-ribosylglycohydrolase family protein [Cellulosimicrobium protaetiae]|uniref:ADP-ribosylglycohydrolase family protein n=1 Tax=Cellulosimicrobium protaetiae TaxID=2587808 RepID=UPI0020A23525|nr:ADP-ribosylglycohydrolase family protein [Cellulosimicrobium protaetiae]